MSAKKKQPKASKQSQSALIEAEGMEFEYGQRESTRKQFNPEYNRVMREMVDKHKAAGVLPANPSNDALHAVMMDYRLGDWQAVRDSLQRQIVELKNRVGLHEIANGAHYEPSEHQP